MYSDFFYCSCVKVLCKYNWSVFYGGKKAIPWFDCIIKIKQEVWICGTKCIDQQLQVLWFVFIKWVTTCSFFPGMLNPRFDHILTSYLVESLAGSWDQTKWMNPLNCFLIICFKQVSLFQVRISPRFEEASVKAESNSSDLCWCEVETDLQLKQHVMHQPPVWRTGKKFKSTTRLVHAELHSCSEFSGSGFPLYILKSDAKFKPTSRWQTYTYLLHWKFNFFSLRSQNSNLQSMKRFHPVILK